MRITHFTQYVYVRMYIFKGYLKHVRVGVEV